MALRHGLQLPRLGSADVTSPVSGAPIAVSYAFLNEFADVHNANFALIDRPYRYEKVQDGIRERECANDGFPR